MLALEREWVKSPGWFHTLDKESQVSLLADYQLRTEKPEHAKARKKRHYSKIARGFNG